MNQVLEIIKNETLLTINKYYNWQDMQEIV